jgi:hypothetical protein
MGAMHPEHDTPNGLSYGRAGAEVLCSGGHAGEGADRKVGAPREFMAGHDGSRPLEPNLAHEKGTERLSD